MTQVLRQNILLVFYLFNSPQKRFLLFKRVNLSLRLAILIWDWIIIGKFRSVTSSSSKKTKGGRQMYQVPRYLFRVCVSLSFVCLKTKRVYVCGTGCWMRCHRKFSLRRTTLGPVGWWAGKRRDFWNEIVATIKRLHHQGTHFYGYDLHIPFLFSPSL